MYFVVNYCTYRMGDPGEMQMGGGKWKGNSSRFCRRCLNIFLVYFFCRARVCWPFVCLCRPIYLFSKRCLKTNSLSLTEGCCQLCLWHRAYAAWRAGTTTLRQSQLYTTVRDYELWIRTQTACRDKLARYQFSHLSL